MDTELRLTASDGSLIGEDDDGGDGFNAAVEVMVAETTSLLIEVTGAGAAVGQYTVLLTAP
jgi:hypothetical protein